MAARLQRTLPPSARSFWRSRKAPRHHSACQSVRTAVARKARARLPYSGFLFSPGWEATRATSPRQDRAANGTSEELWMWTDRFTSGTDAICLLERNSRSSLSKRHISRLTRSRVLAHCACRGHINSAYNRQVSRSICRDPLEK